jgi:hypothetical protein
VAEFERGESHFEGFLAHARNALLSWHGGRGNKIEVEARG